MARPESTGIRTPGFAPDAPRPVSRDVAAPINVRAPMTGAAALAESLGIAAKFGSALAERQENKNVAAGATDAALGKVDPERQKDAAYRRGAFNVEAERQTLEFMQGWQARYLEKLDKSAPVSDIVKDFDSEARGALGHFLEDEQTKAILAKQLTPFIQKLSGEHITAQAEERQIRATETVSASVRQSIIDGGVADFNTAFTTLAPILGPTAAKKAVIQSIIDGAVGLGRPDSIIASLPTELTLADGQKIVGPGADANYADAITRGVEQAKAVLMVQTEQVRRERKSMLEVPWIKDPEEFTQKDYDREIKLSGVDRNFSDNELNSYLGAAERARLARLQGMAIDDELLMNPGVRLRTLEGVLGPDGKPYTAEDLVKAMNRRVEAAFTQTMPRQNENDQQRFIRVAVEHSAREGYPYQPLANDLQLAPPSDFKRFDVAAQQYTAIPPALRSLYVPNEEKRADYDRYNQLLAMGEKPEEAAQTMVNRDLPVVRAALEAHGKAWGRKQAALMKVELRDDWFGRPVLLGDVANALQVATRIEAGARLRIERNMAPDAAVEAATRDVLSSHYVIPGPRKGTSLVLPKENGVSDAAVEVALPWFYEKVIPSITGEDGKPLLPKNVRLSTLVSSKDNTTLGVFDVASGRRIPGSPLFTLSQVTANHQLWEKEEGHRRAAARNNATLDPAAAAVAQPSASFPH